VARLFGEDATSVQRWVRRFEQSGLDGLREGERPGRPRLLDARQWRRLQTDLRKGPREFGFGANLWDGPLLCEHLRKHYQVRLGVRQCQRLFRLVDTRYRLRRPLAAKADPQRQAEHKENSRRGRKTRP
jgi:transposase